MVNQTQEQETPADSQDLVQLLDVLQKEFDILHGVAPGHSTAPPDGNKNKPDAVSSLERLYERIHGLSEERSALCFSGGGIRSATFALGILQGLARANLLDKFHYLSTVSGGGYIGSWLTSWIDRLGNSPQAVSKELSKVPSSPTEPEPKPVAHLRSYSSYLSPRLGLLSADTWTLIAVYIRNLLLNWLTLLPLLAGALMTPRVYAAVVRDMNVRSFTSTDPLLLTLLIVAAALGTFAIGYIGYNRPSSGTGNRNQTSYLRFCLLPLSLGALTLSIFWAGVSHSLIVPSWCFFAFGIGVNFAGFLAWRLPSFLSRSSKVQSSWILELLAVSAAGAVAGWLLERASSASYMFLPNGDIKLATYVCFAFPMVLAIFILSAMLFVGLISFITEDDDREWLSRSDAWILIVTVGWCAVSVVVIYGPLGLVSTTRWVASISGVSGVISVLAGRSASTQGSQKQTEKPNVVSLIMDKALAVAAPIFVVFSLTLLSIAGTALVSQFFKSDFVDVDPQQLGVVDDWHLGAVFRAPYWADVLVAAGLFLISSSMAWFININRFSLHATYRNRLIRAYLGASNLKREPNKFTDFDAKDNSPMHKLWPARAPTERNRLLHVVNMTLNLVKSDKLAWQERKAESFTATPLHCGSRQLGYRDSSQYGGQTGITLGTCMAISGAAASPNMGYHSSRVLSFIMTLFNARLGWWLGNPGPAGAKTFTKDGPVWALKPLITELFGLTDANHSYVYLSDGGHFENLALYEMVRRRCHLIVVCDGGSDQECHFEDLGNAIRKIRIDMGIAIEFEKDIPIFARSDDSSQNEKGSYWSVGNIKYSNVDKTDKDGYLLYIKPAFYGREPRDIYEYAKKHPDFPHQTTANQFFDESQFESYRALGAYIIEQLRAGQPCASIEALVKQAQGCCHGGQTSATQTTMTAQELGSRRGGAL